LDEAVVDELNAMLGELTRVLARIRPAAAAVSSAQETTGARDESR
jgi:hypothetical protein